MGQIDQKMTVLESRVVASGKNRKSFFAKSFPFVIENFWQKPIFDILGTWPHFSVFLD